MALKYEIDKLEDVDEGMRPHYVKTDAGKFRITLDGEPPDSAKVAEFRATNVTLMKERDELRTRFEGIDPETVKADRAKLAELKKAKPDVRIAELETALATEKAASAEAQKRATRSVLRDTLRTKLLAVGVLPAAVDIALDKADPVFAVVNDTVQAKPNTFSKTRPGEPLTPDDWIRGHDSSSSHSCSRRPVAVAPAPVAGIRRRAATELRDPTPAELGEHSAELRPARCALLHSGGQ